MHRIKLLEQLKVTIEALEKKMAESPEKVISEYLVKYQNALNDPDNPKSLDKLLNCARGYLETSSRYDQVFLNEMGESEKLVKYINGL